MVLGSSQLQRKASTRHMVHGYIATGATFMKKDDMFTMPHPALHCHP
jgi:hypothetical protein